LTPEAPACGSALDLAVSAFAPLLATLADIARARRTRGG
jgi:hypothetical protein